MAEYSDHAQRALRRTLQLAEKENCERLYVIRNYTSFDKARAARQGKSGKADRAHLGRGGNGAPGIHSCGRRHRGSDRGALHSREHGLRRSNFVQAVEANLLVVPFETKPEPKPKLPSRIAWVTT